MDEVVKGSSANNRPLSPHQQRFVDALLEDPRRTATEAARIAGYSPRTADRKGHELMQDTRIRSAVEARRRELQEETRVNQRRVVEELARIAFADIGSYYDEGGGLRDLSELTPEQRAAISGIIPGRDGQHRITLHDKQRALEMLAKHLGLFREQVDLTLRGGVIVLPARQGGGDGGSS